MQPHLQYVGGARDFGLVVPSWRPAEYGDALLAGMPDHRSALFVVGMRHTKLNCAEQA